MKNPATTEKDPEIAPEQVRAARALLAWSQQDLAKSASVAVSTIADFERKHRKPVPNNIEAIRGALERAGIRFPPGGAVIGPTIEGLPTLTGGIPIQWIDATDLAQWAERRDGQGALPTLIAKLVLASSRTPTPIRFAANEGIQYEGWDGLSNAQDATDYLPAGPAGWEFGTQRTAIARKASEEYTKRSNNPRGLTPASSTFVFITPRHWPKKEEWVQQRRAEGIWRDVRAYDVNDLVHWIELYPEVGNWLAVAIGKRPQGIRSIEEVWSEWSLATQWPLTEELVLADREETSTAILRWLRGEPSILALQGESMDEVASFFYATINQLPKQTAQHYLSRCLIATNADSARAIEVSRTRLIIILMDPEPGVAQRITRRGHHVLLAYGDGPNTYSGTKMLDRPSREGIEHALINANLPEDRARGLARDSSRSLAVLRRLIPTAPGRLPAWAEAAPPRHLLAALLAGSWDEDKEGDKDVLVRLAGSNSYDDVIAHLTLYTKALDSPLRKVGSTWKISSPRDAWFLFAANYSAADIKKFADIAVEVLGAEDPRFRIDPDERWMASMKGVAPAHSGYLRHGLGETMILLALFGNRAANVPDAQQYSDYIVRSLLDHAGGERWWSLSQDFRLLAEASPHAFLDALDTSLREANPAITALFGADGGVFGKEHLSDLLWALEALAWTPQYIGRVCDLLAKLDERDPGGRYSNRPGNSLRSIFILWHPQTFTKQEDRFRILYRLRQKTPETAWRLMLAILPGRHDTLTPSPQPRWRDFTPDTRETVTYGLIHQGALEISKFLLEDVSRKIEHWKDLLDRVGDLAPGPEAFVEKLLTEIPQIQTPEDRLTLWDAIRKFLHHHRQFPDAEWSLKEPFLQKVDDAYTALQPDDAIERIRWLFDIQVALPKPRKFGWSAEEQEVATQREGAARDVLREEGLDGLFRLAASLERAGFLGAAVAQIELTPDIERQLLARALQSEKSQDRNLAHGYIMVAFKTKKEPWAQELLNRTLSEGWGAEAALIVLGALPAKRWAWEQAEQAGSEIESLYWKRTAPLWIDGERDDIAFAATKLKDAHRARDAIHLVGHNLELNLPSSLLVSLLQDAVSQKGSDTDTNEPTMFQHYVTEVLKALDRTPDVDDDTMFRLEWAYFALLEHSARPPKVLVKAMTKRPEFFMELLKAVFRPNEDSGIEEDARDPETARIVATQAYNLLSFCNQVPGTLADGRIDAQRLEAWTKEVRRLAAESGRTEIADQKIGEVLSSSPVGEDGVWPAKDVRDLIELIASPELENGFAVGLYNRRGVTTRAMGEGGQQERELAAKYRADARASEIDWPRTSAVLNKIADSYEADAKRHDEDAERLEWR